SGLGRPREEHDPVRDVIGHQPLEQGMLALPGMNCDRTARRSHRECLLDQVAQHGTTQQDLGRQQASRFAGPGVDHQVESRRRHGSPPRGVRTLSKSDGRERLPRQAAPQGFLLPWKPAKEPSLPRGPGSLAHCRRLPRRADRGKPPHRGSQGDSQIDPPTQQPVPQPHGHPEEVCDQPESPQVLPREQEAVADRQRVAALDSHFRPEGAKAPMAGDGSGLVIPLEAGHPAAKAQVEILDPSREVDGIVPAKREELAAVDGKHGTRDAVRSARSSTRSWPGTRHIPWTSPNFDRTLVLIPSYSRPSNDQQSGAENNASSWFSNTLSKGPTALGASFTSLFKSRTTGSSNAVKTRL